MLKWTGEELDPEEFDEKDVHFDDPRKRLKGVLEQEIQGATAHARLKVGYDIDLKFCLTYMTDTNRIGAALCHKYPSRE